VIEEIQNKGACGQRSPLDDWLCLGRNYFLKNNIVGHELFTGQHHLHIFSQPVESSQIRRRFTEIV